MKNKKYSRMKKSSLVLLSAASLLLAGSALGSTRAALTYFSDNYQAQLQASHIGVSLLENGKIISSRNYDSGKDDFVTEDGELLKNMLGKDEKFKVGKEYPEELAVQNTGSIDEFVRVRVTRSWSKFVPEGNQSRKDTTLSPELIQLHLTGSWTENPSEATAERMVLYYNKKLQPGETSAAFADKISINGDIAKVVSTITYDNITETKYAYDNYEFTIKAEVDAVQTHNAKDAIKSAWGVDVESDGNTISLK